MVFDTLPKTALQINTVCAEAILAPSAGSIVVRFSASGRRDVQIIADQSDVEYRLRRRLANAQPLLELLQAVLAGTPPEVMRS